MAHLRRGIGSMLSGQASGLVFVQIDGETYMRTAPVRKKNSWSPTQVLHRKRFKEVTRFCTQFSNSVIPLIWKPAARKMTGHAFFLKTNMPAFGLDGSLADPKMLQFSTGKLPLPQQLHAQRVTETSSTINVSWFNDPYLEPRKLQDELMVISAGDGKYSYLSDTGLVRADTNGSFELPQRPVSTTHIYLFFASEDRKDFTASVCFELGTRDF